MDGCINWQGLRWAQGRYGMDKLDGRCMGAHRAAWIRAHGPIPSSLVVCHRCDNGLCVNVEHLFLGTPKENMQDCSRKGRQITTCQKGQSNHNAKPNLKQRYQAVRDDIEAGISWRETRERNGLKSNGHLAQILKTNL